MTYDTLAQYQNIQTTNRPARRLARAHGFKNTSHLANSLPENANVLDAGAGDSSLGKKVATVRPDIHWVNFDYSYYSGIPDKITQDCPPNLSFVAGDVTKLSERFAPESFHAVFSYWMMPHLSIDSDEPARQAAEQLFIATKQGGSISLGPDMSKAGNLPLWHLTKALKVAKDETTNVDDFANRAVEYTRTEGYNRLNLLLSRDVAVPYFGTSRFARGLSVYDPVEENYISILSPRSVTMVGQLAIASASYTLDRVVSNVLAQGLNDI